MSLLRRILVVAASLSMFACGGGGGDAGTSPFNPTPTPGAGVSNLVLTLSSAAVNNSGSETVTATVTAINASSQTMAGASVQLSVDSDAVITVNGAETDANGKLTGTVLIGENRNNRAITVTARANNGELIRTRTFQVVGAKLTGTPVPAVLTPQGAGKVQWRLVDANANAMPGVGITITGPGGVQSQAVTGTNGDYEYSYTAPTTTGELSLKAAAGGAELSVAVQVQSGGSSTIPPVDPTTSAVRSASLSANPSVVPVNTATSTTNQSQLRALFLTDGNAPVKNVRVRFDLAGDTNSIGGSIAAGTNLVYSDVNGVATTSYIAGTRASPIDGLTLRACWDYADFAAGTCPNQALARLTVTADPVSISIGTNGLLAIGTNGLTYVKSYVVQVVDSSGVAKSGVQITPSIDLLRYFKGEWFVVGPRWEQTVRASCDNEDLNRNNTNEVYSNGAVEDANNSLNLTPGRPALEPRKADVAVSFDGDSKTNQSGAVVLKLEYPQNLASWVEFNLQVSASGVSATEGRANFQGILPVLASAVTNVNAEPAFSESPYGVQTSPVLFTVNPAGQSGQLCTNPN